LPQREATFKKWRAWRWLKYPQPMSVDICQNGSIFIRNSKVQMKRLLQQTLPVNEEVRSGVTTPQWLQEEGCDQLWKWDWMSWDLGQARQPE
jgi:hypothetical protein